jgi:deoxyribose-phosphate aldolase
MSEVTYLDLAKMIDHSLLQPTLTDAEMEAGIAVAIEYQVASICIKPYYVARCAQLLAGSGVKTSTVIGFPHGGNVTAIKAAESVQAMKDGAVELDMVCNIGKVLSKDWTYVSRDIKAVVDVAHQAGAKVKVIFENCFLADEHKIELCKICGDVNADWVKTSTGYGATGAIDDDLKLMRKHSPAHVQVKAAGGVRDFDRLMAVRKIGVTRVGATATKGILDSAKAALGAK